MNDEWFTYIEKTVCGRRPSLPWSPFHERERKASSSHYFASGRLFMHSRTVWNWKSYHKFVPLRSGIVTFRFSSRCVCNYRCTLHGFTLRWNIDSKQKRLDFITCCSENPTNNLQYERGWHSFRHVSSRVRLPRARDVFLSPFYAKVGRLRRVISIRSLLRIDRNLSTRTCVGSDDNVTWPVLTKGVISRFVSLVWYWHSQKN